MVLTTLIPSPPFLPSIKHVFNDYLIFDLNTSALVTAFYLSYYILLEPVAAILYAPQLILSLLSATAYASRPDGIRNAVIVQVISWIAQFIGHGLAEGRAPALLDNIVGALVLAPFFVHLELLFMLGYRPELHKQIKNSVGIEIAKLRREQAERRRATEKKTK